MPPAVRSNSVVLHITELGVPLTSNEERKMVPGQRARSVREWRELAHWLTKAAVKKRSKEERWPAPPLRVTS